MAILGAASSPMSSPAPVAVAAVAASVAVTAATGDAGPTLDAIGDDSDPVGVPLEEVDSNAAVTDAVDPNAPGTPSSVTTVRPPSLVSLVHALEPWYCLLVFSWLGVYAKPDS